MKKTFKLEDLDCANCAAKMEDAISKLPGVTNVRVNFMMQKMTLEAAEEDFEDILKRAVETIRNVEPDCHVVV